MNYFIFDLDETLYKLKDNIIQSVVSLELINRLKSYGKIIIFSNASYSHCLYWFNILNIINKIDVIITSDNIHGYKPNPIIYSKLINIVGIKNLDTVYFFEDSYINLYTASQFGWKTILINNIEIINNFKNILNFKLDYNFNNVNDGILMVLDLLKL